MLVFFSAMNYLSCPFPKPVFDNVLLAVKGRIHEYLTVRLTDIALFGGKIL